MKKNPKIKNFILILGIVLVFLIIVSSIGVGVYYLITNNSNKNNANIAIIPITGTITSYSGTKSSSYTYSEDVQNQLNDALANKKIKAIILEINSGGGTAVASYEIAQAVKKASQEKPVIAVIKETGASGAYWVASAADKIYANPISITGSIGVIGSYLEFSGLLERFNITYQQLIGGKYKDIGTQYKELTPDEKAILQQFIDELHSFFILNIAQNRNLSISYVTDLSNGLFYSGLKAKELKLIDEFGGINEAIDFIEKNQKIKAKTFRYEKETSILENLYGLNSDSFFWIGKGIGSIFLESQNQNMKISV